jgi:hypothetical protein
MGFLFCTLILSFASLAAAGVPDLTLSQCTTDAGAAVSVYTLPDGTGARIDEAYAFGGALTDATIRLTLVDGNGTAINGYPRTDMWLESINSVPGSDAAGGNGLRLCVNGSQADFDSNVDGMTLWRLPVFGGGASDPDAAVAELTNIVVSEGAVQCGLPVYWNSPDINGDLDPNVGDVGLFAQDFFGHNDSGVPIEDVYRSNFFWDANMNLADIALLAQGVLAAGSCP